MIFFLDEEMPLLPNVQRRIMSQMQTVQETDNMSIEVANLDSLTMMASINGPRETPYENGVITLNISFPSKYPSKPPHITCATKVWHPNISLHTGAICLEILEEKYSAEIDLKEILLSIMKLSCCPNTSDPINRNAAQQYDDDREKFDTEVKEYKSLKKPTSSASNTSTCSSSFTDTSDISTRMALARCVWNIGIEDNVQWQLEEVMVAILNVHKDTIGRFPEEFDNWSILLKDENERSTHRKVTLHIDQCQHSANPQNGKCVLDYTLPVGGRHVAYIYKQDETFYHCVNTLRKDKSDSLKIPIGKKGNIVYEVSITSTRYGISSTHNEIKEKNEYLKDHWELFWAIARDPKQDSELEEFCGKMHLLAYYQTCMRRWEIGKFSFDKKLADLFNRWRRVLRDTTFGFNDGLKLITFMKERLASQHQTQSLPGTSQQPGDSCLATSSHAFGSSTPIQEEDQGQTLTCTRYALTKCVFNSTKRRAEEEQMPPISQSLISTAVLNILPDCHGSWPEEFDDQLFLTLEKDKEGPMVRKFAMHIRLCECADYTQDKEYILVYGHENAGRHTVYVKGKYGNNWRCQNSRGNQDKIVDIPTDAPDNQLYKVDVEEVEREKKSFYLKERLGSEALKMFLDNMEKSIEPKNNEGLQTYCESMGFHHKFEPRWERDNLEWEIRLEEVFEYLWREKYEYFIVKLLSKFIGCANHESEVNAVVDTTTPEEENDDHEVKNGEYGENDARSGVGTTT